MKTPNSSFIYSVDANFSAKKLTVAFKSHRRTMYTYSGVKKETLEAMMKAAKNGGSVGSIFSYFVRGKYAFRKAVK